jgi:hypothetical protein
MRHVAVPWSGLAALLAMFALPFRFLPVPAPRLRRNDEE